MASQNSASLQVGAGKVDITPEMGIQIAGDMGRPRPVEEVRDPLYARAIVFEQGGERFAVCQFDLCWMTDPYVEKVRSRVAERCGIAPQRVMLHASQTHSAPAVGHTKGNWRDDLIPPELDYLKMGDRRYDEPAMAGMVEAICQAAESLQPVTVRAARATDGRVAFNRRFVMRDGKSQTHPRVCDPNILHVEGPTDPEVGVVTFVGEDGQAVAALLHHSCHPCHGFPHNWISADWPGLWAEAAGELFGDGCMAMTINGCCGNLHHSNSLDPEKPHNTYPEMVAKLMESTRRAVEGMVDLPAGPLASADRVLRIPLRDLPGEAIAAAEKLVAAHPEPVWEQVGPGKRTTREWFYAVMMLDLKRMHDTQPFYDYEVQALRIGDFALAGWTGEPFVQAQLGLKLASPASYTFVAHMSNGYVGYIPTAEAFSRGHDTLETREGLGSKLAVDALETIERETTEMLAELFAAK